MSATSKVQTKNKSPALQAFQKDLLCASFAGVLNCLTGHPLDSVKVRMQSAKPRASLVQIVKQMFVNEGLLGFYKGVGPPMITVPLINSIIFASYEFCKRMLGV